MIVAVLGQTPGQTPLDQTPGQTPPAPKPQTLLEQPRPGVQLETGGGWLHPVLTLSGPGVDQSFKERLIAWLQGTG